MQQGGERRAPDARAADVDACSPVQSGNSLGRNRDFNLLWSSQALSDLATYGTQLAMPLLVLAAGGSAAEAGAIGTTTAVGSLVGRLPGGALADRFDRRRLLLASDAVRCLAIGAVGLSVAAGHVSLLMIALCLTVVALAGVVFSPAEMAAVSSLVPEAQLPTAFARNEARTHAASLGGPALGGALFGLGQAVPFLVEALTYLVSLACVALIRRPLGPSRAGVPAPSMLLAIKEGLRHVLGSAFLRALMLIAAPVNFGLTGALFATTVIWRMHSISPGVIGVTLGLVSAGGLAGAVLSSWIQARLGFRALTITIVWTLAASAAAAAALAPHLTIAIPLATGMFLAPAVNASLFGQLAATTPSDMQGRVLSIVMLAATAAAALAPLTMGLLLEHGGEALALLVCAAALAGAAVAATTSHGLRS